MSLSPTTPSHPLSALTADAAVTETKAAHLPTELEWWRLFLGIAFFILVAWLVDFICIRVLAGRAEVAIRLTGAGVLTGIATGVLSSLQRLRAAVLHAISSLQFAVALLTTVMIATFVGTWILQGELQEVYSTVYWGWLADAILFLGFDDLFHSLWFGALLILLAISLVVTIYKHRAWRLPTIGLFLSHFGVITLVFAGMVAYVAGFKGRMDLHEGNSAGALVLTRHGRDTADQYGIGFQIRLDRFEVEKYPAKNRLYLYHRDGQSFLRIKAIDATPAEAWTAGAGPDTAFRVVAYYPEFAFDSTLEAAQPGLPGAELQLDDAGTHRQLALGAGDTDRLRLVTGGPLMVFLPEPPDAALLKSWFQAQPPVHLLAADQADIPDPLQVNPGSMYQFAGESNHIQVLQYVSDFSIDRDSKEVISRSPAANNPALQIAVISADGVRGKPQWLFANAPDFSMGHGGEPGAKPAYHYTFKPGRNAETQVFAFVASTGELLDCRAGAIQARQSLAEPCKLADGIRLLSARVLPAARVIPHPVTLSQEPRNPVVAVEIKDNGQLTTQYLSPEHAAPYTFADQQTILSFETGDEEVKSYRSHVTVIDGGREVLSEVIAVNSPLSYGGYHFYQANYRRDDPTYSGFNVVHDPGLPLIWIGLAMISLGVVYNYYVRPRIMGRIQQDA